jgi:trehalose utilization protein
MKTRTNISIDPELLVKAKEKNINISSVVEDALVERIDLVSRQVSNNKGLYPFELCEREIPDHLKKILFGCASIKARRCHECERVWFVNDAKGEFQICKECWSRK